MTKQYESSPRKVTLSREDVPVDFAKLYYQHQYDRFAKIESGNISLTNIVVTLSIVAFTFGFKDSADKLNLLNGIGLPIIIIISNLFSIGYTRRGYRYMLTHQARAKEMLRIHTPELYKYDGINPIASPYRWSGRMNIQTLLHCLLIAIAFLPIVIFLWQTIKA